MTKKNISTSEDSLARKLKVLGKKSRGIRREFTKEESELSPESKKFTRLIKKRKGIRREFTKEESKLSHKSKKLAGITKGRKGIRREFTKEESEISIQAKKLAATATEKESTRRKLVVTAKEKESVRLRLAVVAKQLATTAKEKENIRGKLALTAETLRLRAKQLAVLAKEKESVRRKLVVTAAKLAATAEKLAMTAKEKESVRLKLAITAKQLSKTTKEKESESYTALEYANDDLKKYKMAIEAASDHIIITDDKGAILYINKGAESFTGYSREEAIGENASLWGGQMPKEFYADMWKTIREDKKPFSAELKNRRKNGELYDAEIHISPVFDESGDIRYFIGVERDITKEKAVDKAKTEFIFTVSHELRTPLAIIIEGIGLVTDEIIGKINEKQKETLLIAKNNLYRLSSIINNMLDIAKIEAGKMEINKKLVDMGELIKKVVDSLRPKADKKGLQLRIVLPEKGVNIYADSDKITQVLINLINNSIKFTNAGHIEVGVKEFPNEIQCYISDTGIGIANESLPLAFEKFQQFDRQPGSGEKGTGLGLAICKAIVVSHQGKIWVESEKGKWTKVIFTLPKRSNKKN